jgi:hypothetical protein
VRGPAFAVVSVTLLLALSFAGCLDDAPTRQREVARRGAIGSRPAENLSAIEERIDQRLTTSPQPTVNDWFVLEGTASPSGNLTGFRWTIPLGGIVGMRFCCDTGVILEVAPIVVNGATIHDWCLGAFRKAEGRAVLMGVYPQVLLGAPSAPPAMDFNHPERRWGLHCEKSEERLVRDPVAGDNRSLVPANVTPAYVFLVDRHVQELDNLYFVLAAKADKATPFGLAFRVLPQFPSAYFPGSANPADAPASSLDVFLARLGGLPPRAVAVVGRGEGLVMNYWRSDRGLGAGSTALVGSYEAHAGDLAQPASVVDAHPVGAAWSFNLSSEADAPGGWSFVYADYKSLCGTGRYVGSADLHGTPFMARSLIAQHLICLGLYGAIPGLLLFGQSSYMFVAGGNGPAKANHELLVAGVVQERMEFHHVAFGAPLDTIIGMPAAPGRYMDGGIAGNVPP